MAFRLGRRQREVAELKAELEELRSRLDATSGAVSRRGLLRTASAAAAGAVAGVVVSATPASATDGSNIIVGPNSNAAPGVTTSLTGSTSGVSSSLFTVTQGASGSGSGARAITATTSAATGVAIEATATVTNGTGVFVNADLVGVEAQASNADGIALQGKGIGTRAIGVRAISQNNAPLLIDPRSLAMPPTSGDWEGGSLFVDGDQQLWYCHDSGTGSASSWVRLSSPFVPLAAPSRVYDSRAGFTPDPGPSPKGTLAFGAAARTIDCSAAVPTGAKTILFNLAVTGTAGLGAGALLVWAAGASEPLASSINWSTAGQTLANAVTSACSTSQDVQVKCVASTGSSTHFILDVIGYYL